MKPEENTCSCKLHLAEHCVSCVSADFTLAHDLGLPTRLMRLGRFADIRDFILRTELKFPFYNGKVTKANKSMVCAVKPKETEVCENELNFVEIACLLFLHSRPQSPRSSISFPEAAIRLVSTKNRRAFGHRWPKTRGLWERDWLFLQSRTQSSSLLRITDAKEKTSWLRRSQESESLGSRMLFLMVQQGVQGACVAYNIIISAKCVSTWYRSIFFSVWL